MHTEELKNTMKEYARDIRLNLSTVLTEEGAPGLNTKQIWGVALACAYSTKHTLLIETIQTEAQQTLPTEFVEAAKGASTIMAMNNIYYRFTHLAEDKEYLKMPARLRMNFIGNPGIDKIDFELMCLAVSAITGCGVCINSHALILKKAGLSGEAIQSAVRIASVINASAQALYIG